TSNASPSRSSAGGGGVSSRSWGSPLMSNQDVLTKIERLKSRVREVQKYELMTTNQYRKQVALIIEILEDLAKLA
ncbi:MAG: hypothetical protein NWE75_06510, partial [Candidatus Bathyarchaeota archaeon]|nr:hypothetical protein [Candidatus Bathyarchaeota archaeon]